MRYFLCFCWLFFSQNVFSQFGVRTTYNINAAPGWDQFFDEITGQDPNIFASSLTFTLDYWIRLPNHRIEFYPYLSYHSTKSQLGISFLQPSGILIEGGYDFGLRQIGGGLYTHIYILDLINDCECPTFSKQGDFFKKGFFVVAGFGADYSLKAFDDSYRDGNFDLKGSIGIGQDIGVSDFLTISPFIQYQYFPHISWHELGADFGQGARNIETSFSQIQLGIRVGFRPDYNR